MANQNIIVDPTIDDVMRVRNRMPSRAVITADGTLYMYTLNDIHINLILALEELGILDSDRPLEAYTHANPDEVGFVAVELNKDGVFVLSQAYSERIISMFGDRIKEYVDNAKKRYPHLEFDITKKRSDTSMSNFFRESSLKKNDNVEINKKNAPSTMTKNVLLFEEFSEMLSTQAIYEKKFTAEKRKELAKKGLAMHDGSFPIETAADLKNAVKTYGLAKDKSKVKAFIRKRAAALGKTDTLPEGWAK